MTDLQRVAGEVSEHMEQIVALFKPGVKITVLVRVPGFPERDFMMTDDDPKETIAMIERRATAKATASMNPIQRDLARHALGLPNDRNLSYRNHFVTGEGTTDHAPWIEMVSAGLATRRKGNSLTGGDDLFRLTKTGAVQALNKGEHLDPEDFPEGGAA